MKRSYCPLSFKGHWQGQLTHRFGSCLYKSKNLWPIAVASSWIYLLPLWTPQIFLKWKSDHVTFPAQNPSLDFCHSWDKHRDPCCGSQASAASSVVVSHVSSLLLTEWQPHLPFFSWLRSPISFTLKNLYSGCFFLLLDIFFPPLCLPWLTQLLKRHILGKHPSAESSDLLTFPILNTYACVC